MVDDGKKRVRTFIATDPDGRIHTKYIGIAFPGKSLHKTAKTEVTDPDQLVLIQRAKIEGCYFKRGKVQEKGEIKLIPDKWTIMSDGVDTVTIRMENVPKEYRKVKLQVSGVGEVVLDRNDTITLDCDTIQRLFVRVNEPQLKNTEIDIEVDVAAAVERRSRNA